MEEQNLQEVGEAHPQPIDVNILPEFGSHTLNTMSQAQMKVNNEPHSMLIPDQSTAINNITVEQSATSRFKTFDTINMFEVAVPIPINDTNKHLFNPLIKRRKLVGIFINRIFQY